jgi:hypothetical protein
MSAALLALVNNTKSAKTQRYKSLCASVYRLHSKYEEKLANGQTAAAMSFLLAWPEMKQEVAKEVGVRVSDGA